MRILLTGGAGFIGSAVAKALALRGDTVISVDNFNDYYEVSLKEARAKFFLSHKNIVSKKADIGDLPAMEKVFSENPFDAVCHLAAQAGVRYSLENPFVYEKSNLLGTLNILELMKKHDVKKLVYASSSSVYGGNTKVPFSESDPVDCPISLYAATKKSNELMAYTYHHLFGIHSSGLRFFTVYGPWGRPDMALFKFTKKISNGEAIDVYNNGDMERDFTYIDDIVDGVVRATDRVEGYEIYNLGNNNPIVLHDFIAALESALGVKSEKNIRPMQPGDVKKTYADIAKAKNMLGWQPKTDIVSGISSFVKWYKEYYG